MAEIKDGFYGFIGGTVSRVFPSKNGMSATIEIRNERSEYPDRVTVWGIADNFSEGDRVKVKGWVSFRSKTWEKQDGSTGYGVDVSINSGEVLEHETTAAALAAVGAVEVPGWGSDDTPF